MGRDVNRQTIPITPQWRVRVNDDGDISEGVAIALSTDTADHLTSPDGDTVCVIESDTHAWHPWAQVDWLEPI